MSKKLLLVTLSLASGLLITTAKAEQSPYTHVAESSALENTELNVRDQNNATLTPEDQKETEGDIKITTDIRQAVIRDKSLSINAQNIKIITRNAVVTLRGSVETKNESQTIHHIAVQTPGVLKVDNQLENIAP